MKRADFRALHQKVCDDARTLMMKKSEDYASSDDTFENFRLFEITTGMPTVLGVWPRFLDKVKRLGKAVQGGEFVVEDESAYDTIMDLINYAIIIRGLMIEEAPSRHNHAPPVEHAFMKDRSGEETPCT